MAVQGKVLAYVAEEIKKGFAAEGQALVGTDGPLNNLRAALRPIFDFHGGRVLADVPGVNALLATGLSREGFSAVAALKETQSFKPSYLVELER